MGQLANDHDYMLFTIIIRKQPNPLTSVSHWSGFKVKLTFHGIQLFGSSLYTGHILDILCLQID